MRCSFQKREDLALLRREVELGGDGREDLRRRHGEALIYQQGRFPGEASEARICAVWEPFVIASDPGVIAGDLGVVRCAAEVMGDDLRVARPPRRRDPARDTHRAARPGSSGSTPSANRTHASRTLDSFMTRFPAPDHRVEPHARPRRPRHPRLDVEEIVEARRDPVAQTAPRPPGARARSPSRTRRSRTRCRARARRARPRGSGSSSRDGRPAPGPCRRTRRGRVDRAPRAFTRDEARRASSSGSFARTSSSSC